MADELNFVFKKIANREYTSTAKRWFEEVSGVPIKLNGADVWIDEIQPTPPLIDTAVVQVFNTLSLQEDMTTAYQQSWKAEYPVGNRIGSFIPPRYGNSYVIRVYDGNDSEIPIGNESAWFFDYEMGILTFDNPPSNYGWNDSVFKIKAYRYVGRTVDDITTGSGGLLASQIVNDSTVSGSTVKDALDYLDSFDHDLSSHFRFNQSLTVVSGTKIYSLNDVPVSGTVQIYVNGLLQEPGISNDYVIDGQIITFITDNLEIDDILLSHYMVN